MIFVSSMRTLQFDGVEYLDGTASDPNSMGWMQGHPPAPDRVIRFDDDRFLEFPRNRWALSHLRELVPTVNVWRGPGRSGDLGTPAPADETAIDRMEFDDLNGRRLCWADSLADTYTDGIAVSHRGRLVYERYRGALRRELPHACFSITKSYAATLAATLIHENVLDPSRRVLHYLPEMAGTAYADATLREVLDMQIGVAYSELYSDPAAQIWQYSRAGGLRPRPAGYQGAGSFYDYLVTLRKEGEHGTGFAYKTVNTEVLCWVMQRASGASLGELLSRRLWSQLPCEEDGYICVDSQGVAMGGGGLAATLRDLVRFGELMRCEGASGADKSSRHRWSPISGAAATGQSLRRRATRCFAATRIATCGGSPTTSTVHSKRAGYTASACTWRPERRWSSPDSPPIRSPPARQMTRSRWRPCSRSDGYSAAANYFVRAAG